MLKERVQQRLEALHITQWDAARRAGLHRNFVYDLLEGRKQKPQHKTMLALARALQCSPEFLSGASDDVGSPPPAAERAEGGLPVLGIIEEGAWRRPSGPRGTVLIQPDQRFQGRQFAFLYRGDTVGGLEDGMFVLAVDPEDYHQQSGNPPVGHPVVVELRRKTLGEAQTVMRPWAAQLEQAQGSRDVEARIVGVVAASFRLY